MARTSTTLIEMRFIVKRTSTTRMEVIFTVKRSSTRVMEVRFMVKRSSTRLMEVSFTVIRGPLHPKDTRVSVTLHDKAIMSASARNAEIPSNAANLPTVERMQRVTFQTRLGKKVP